MTSRPPRLAVVTGAASGIGRAVVRTLTASGVICGGIDAEPGEDVALQVDVTDTDALLAGIDRLQLELGRSADILVNVAGIWTPSTLTQLDWSAVRQTLAVNLEAPVRLTAHLAPGMAHRGWGRIVNVTSVHASATEPAALAYAMSKAGLEALTRSTSIEFAHAGVLVNSVAPGFVDTPMCVVDGVNEMDTPQFRRDFIDSGRLALARAAEPEEVAELVSWLVSEKNTYTTGSRIVIDGGMQSRF